MLIQGFLDWLRDMIAIMLGTLGIPLIDLDTQEAGQALGSAAAQAGYFLALFISPSVWGPIGTAFGIFVVTFGVTGLIAVIARRGTSS